MTVLPQLHATAFSNTVRDTVSLGRYPHQSAFFPVGKQKMKKQLLMQWNKQA